MPPPSRMRIPPGRGVSSHTRPSPHYVHHQRRSVKEHVRYTGKMVDTKNSPPSTAASPPAATTPSTAREEALRAALARALSHNNEGDLTSTAAKDVDAYGIGSPTDRLQFGYSPTVTAEAVAFHARFTKDDWVSARRHNGRLVFVEKQRLQALNCEPMTSILKLQNHWKRTNAFQHHVRGGSTSRLRAEELDKLVDMLASKQRIGPDEEHPFA